MSIDQRLAKLKGHALIFSHEFRDLIESFEMLVPVAQNRELLKNFPNPNANPALELCVGASYRPASSASLNSLTINARGIQLLGI